MGDRIFNDTFCWFPLKIPFSLTLYLCRYTIPKSLRQFRLLATTQIAAAFVFNFSRCCCFIFFACLASVVYPWKCFTIILCRPCDLMWNIEHSTLYRAVGNMGTWGHSRMNSSIECTITSNMFQIFKQ